MRMLTASALVAAVAIALAGQANAAGFSGVVVAKQTSRGTLVLAARGGAGLTVRSSSRARLGDRVEVRGSRLRDGTIRASRLSVRSHTRHAVVRAAVIRDLQHRTFASVGHSVITIRHARHGHLRAGTIGEFRVRIDDDGLQEEAEAKPLAQAGNVQIEGRVVSVTPFVVSLEGLPITITVPAGTTLPVGLSAGDRIELVVQVGAANLFTLVRIDEIENENEDEQEVEIEGAVVSSTAAQLVVRSHNITFTFAPPTGTTLPVLAVGTPVEVRGVMVNGVLTATRIKVEDDDDDDGHGGHGPG
jgi:RNase P/RNase MRP subunit p29